MSVNTYIFKSEKKKIVFQFKFFQYTSVSIMQESATHHDTENETNI